MAGVKRGKGRGNWARVVSRPYSLPLPFRTPATQASWGATLFCFCIESITTVLTGFNVDPTHLSGLINDLKF